MAQRGKISCASEAETRAGGVDGRRVVFDVLMRVHVQQCGSRVVAKEARSMQSMRQQCGAVRSASHAAFRTEMRY